MLVRDPYLFLAYILQAVSLPFIAVTEFGQRRFKRATGQWERENSAPIDRETGYSFTRAIEAYEEIIDTVCASAQAPGEF